MHGNGGDAVVAALKALGVDTVFSIASVHNLPMLDAIERDGSIKIIDCRHEQNATHAADGYSRATGKLGVSITSTGPGAANAAGGLFEARFASSRVLMLTGQVESKFYGQGRAFLHEADEQMAYLQSMTRQAWSVRRTADLLDDVIAAGRTAMSGRPAPTAVEIPIDFQYAEFDFDEPASVEIRRTSADAAEIAKAAELLRAAKRPVLWAGGGVNHAGAAAELQAFAEQLQIPVVTSQAGRGSIPEDHDLCVGALVNEKPVIGLLKEADVVLAIGTHFHMVNLNGWTIPLGTQLIHVDVDPENFDRNYRTAVRVNADALDAIEALTAAVTSTDADPDWLATAQKARDEAQAGVRDLMGEKWVAIMESIRRHLPAAGPVVRDATVPAYVWGNRLLPILTSRTSMMPVSNAIGPGLPLAIGATIGAGERAVCIHGDGGIMLSIGDLPVLAQYNLPLTVIVFNDRGYGILRKIQGATFDGPLHDVDLATPDFAKLAEACGIDSAKVSTPEEFDKAFAASVSSDGPMVIEVDMSDLGELKYGGKQRLLSDR
ncbi:thiamine pyrophosphate-binding protein [Epidermidibacterium keratini]|uniref:Thiamine pyrophosphate-binding protein n=1 Tax=Epidermidibacterium keratini TaxID=1891644 RepID=A0A7L4YMA9_9ACTN|nr:thiamine pyrophosphate-binding protein [Epidermidibacterium keratini]QHC00421.1 thiamine pyrophosphate-binding protein [Epidermidibacterium keratini]